jgi:hypothetical protein
VLGASRCVAVTCRASVEIRSTSGVSYTAYSDGNRNGEQQVQGTSSQLRRTRAAQHSTAQHRPAHAATINAARPAARVNDFPARHRRQGQLSCAQSHDTLQNAFHSCAAFSAAVQKPYHPYLCTATSTMVRLYPRPSSRLQTDI